MYRIGIDLGGTKIEGIVLDENAKEIQRKRIPNGKEEGYKAVLNNIKSVYDDLCESINNADHKVGIGMPGSISKQTGLLKNCNITFMNGKPFKEDLIETLGHNVGVENDANCFAMAEALIGAGKGKDLVFGVILGTGVGGGLVYKGQVIQGMRENAGEWGHSTINFDGPEWCSGTPGAVESYLSGTGIQLNHEKKFGQKLSTSDIVYNYRKGEREATETMNEFLELFGISIANIIKFLDPDVIVLGGGVSNVDEIYEEGLKRVKKYCLNQDLYTAVVKNEYGDSAGVFGAALIGQ